MDKNLERIENGEDESNNNIDGSSVISTDPSARNHHNSDKDSVFSSNNNNPNSSFNSQNNNNNNNNGARLSSSRAGSGRKKKKGSSASASGSGINDKEIRNMIKQIEIYKRENEELKKTISKSNNAQRIIDLENTVNERNIEIENLKEENKGLIIVCPSSCSCFSLNYYF